VVVEATLVVTAAKSEIECRKLDRWSKNMSYFAFFAADEKFGSAKTAL
jgi:hypothetical protein